MIHPDFDPIAFHFFPFYELFLMISEDSLFKPAGRPLSVLILVFDETNALSLASVVDPLRAANRRAGKKLFDWKFATPGGGLARLTAGIPINAPGLFAAQPADLLISVASFNIEPQLSPRLLTALRNLAHRAQGIAAVDGGAWALARAGLLNGYAATAHWEEHAAFTAAFPEIDTKRSRFVIDRNRLTTGGAAPCLDMMLELMSRRHGPALAARVASAFIYDPVRDGATPQTQLPTATIARRDAKVAKAVTMMADRLEDPLPISEISKLLNMTPRTLELRFQKALGTAPKSYYLTLRLSEAQRLASETRDPVQDIAFATGFSSQAAFARAFKAAFGQSVRDLRKAAA